MKNVNSHPKILIVGVVPSNAGHPNVENKIKILERNKNFEVALETFNIPLSINYSSPMVLFLSLLKIAARMLSNGLRILITLIKYRKTDLAYIPYPSLITALIASFLPNWLKPKRIILDLFISVYDTIVFDRKLVSKNSFIAKTIFIFEKRTLSKSSLSICDTPENGDYYSKLFNLERSKFNDLPISIDETTFFPLSSTEKEPNNIQNNDSLSILFIGTLVPLQGIEFLINSIINLNEHVKVSMEIIGEGQDSDVVKKYMNVLENKNNLNFKWTREWLDYKSLAGKIQHADLCLGIFGSNAKSDRVWPQKNYLYLSCGKTIITKNTKVTNRMKNNHPSEYFYSIDINDSHSLTALITKISQSRNSLKSSEKNALEAFKMEFSSAAIETKINDLFTKLLNLK